MKRVLLIVGLFMMVLTGQAQNIQLHYDLGRSLYNNDELLKARPLLTSTVEMFKPDAWGSTYFFIDMDYTSDGVSSAYWEIGRELKFWKGPLSAHVEYNGGLNYIKNAYLVGPTYTYNNEDFTAGLTFTAMYKYIQKHHKPNNFQLTGVWYWHFANRKCTFSGFADWWREPNAGGNYIFLSEPQFWVNLYHFKGFTPKLSVGTEIELSHNFAGREGFYAIPTIALKWSFD